MIQPGGNSSAFAEIRSRRTRNAVAACLLASFSPASMAGMTIDALPNLIGGGVGVTSAYSGADEYIVGVIPGGRYRSCSA